MSTIVFTLNTSCGFFSIFFFLCKAYIYAKKNNLPFYIKNNKWAYDGGKGWHGYFTSLKLYLDNEKSSQPQIWSHGSIPHTIPKYPLSEYIECIPEIFCLQPELLAMARQFVQDIGTDFLSIYVRRGDKHTETNFLREEEILKKIGFAEKSYTHIFLQTDDYSVIERFRVLLPNCTIHSRIPITKRGHYQSQQYLYNSRDKNPYKQDAVAFNDIQDKDRIREDTIELLTSIVISSMAKECWVDASSNVGRFLQLYSPLNTYPYTGKSADPKQCCDPYWPF